jgi:hypothetical protein
MDIKEADALRRLILWIELNDTHRKNEEMLECRGDLVG